MKILECKQILVSYKKIVKQKWAAIHEEPLRVREGTTEKMIHTACSLRETKHTKVNELKKSYEKNKKLKKGTEMFSIETCIGKLSSSPVFSHAQTVVTHIEELSPRLRSM